MTADSDAPLVARCRQGDERAWDALFELHYAAAARFVFQLSPGFSHEDVEEICQETFLAVIKNIGSFQGGSRLQTWIFRIAANKARDYRERQQAAKRGGGQTVLSLQEENDDNSPSLQVPGSLPAPDSLLLRAEFAAQMELLLARLEEPCREIIQLRYFADLSYDELAGELKLNPKTVSSRLSKCLDKLEKIALEVFGGKITAPFSV
ncbi:MAG TPA: RNA polymerase sigma factor [Candidatus Cybelea sp.]|nr:RNA polymerase sigma factor [Candidatus Cybelea sp.]